MAFIFWDWIILLGTILGVLYAYNKWRYGYFGRHGVKYIQPSVPFIGHIWMVISKQESLNELLGRIYKTFPDERYVGLYGLSHNGILLKDVNLIRQIAVNDFIHFTDHMYFVNESLDPLYGRHLVSLKGQEWRDMRSTLSPAFTGSKMKEMFNLTVECAEQLTNYCENQFQKLENQDLLEVEMKDVFSRCASDVIISCAFGIKTNSLEDRTNELLSMGRKATTVRTWMFLKTLLIDFAPWLAKILNIRVMDDDVLRFFRRQIQGQMKQREETGYFRQDMINLLMEAKKGSLKHEKINENDDFGFATIEESTLGRETHKRVWAADDLTSQAVLFFAAGYHTSPITLGLFAHEMILNPEIQKRLQQEIDETYENSNEKLTYSDVQKMKYLDMVVSETLRFWPPITVAERLCTKPYQLPPPSNPGVPYQVNVKDMVFIPIEAIHHDPQYYPNPEKFDPERFSDENKSSINRYAYMPFGSGPRSCIGSRLALMELKVIIFYSLLKFDFVQCSKTQIPLKFLKSELQLLPENGIWVGLKRRLNNLK